MRACPSLFSVAVLLLACGVSGCAPAPAPARGVSTSGAIAASPAGQDALRRQEIESDARTDPSDDDALDDQEKDTLKALRQALGKASSHGGDAPEASSAYVLALRRTSVKLRLEAMPNLDGEVNDGSLLDLKDSMTERLKRLQPKITGGTLSKSETREIQESMKVLKPVMELRGQILDVSSQTSLSNAYVQHTGLSTVLKVANMAHLRARMGMEWSAADYARVQRYLERMRRAEAIAAASLGMLAAYEAVINRGGDPKALDAIAASAVKAFPWKPVATIDDAKKYVANFRGNVTLEKARYERMMRVAYGDAKYEKRHKADVDALFAQAGELDDPPAAGPAAPSSAPAAAPAATRGSDLAGALDGAASMFPDGGTLQSSLAGISAITKGDAKGALGAALNLVPGGGIVKDGLSLAASLLFGGAKKG